MVEITRHNTTTTAHRTKTNDEIRDEILYETGMISRKTTDHGHMGGDKDKEKIEKSKTITQIDEEHSEMSRCFSITSVTRAESIQNMGIQMSFMERTQTLAKLEEIAKFTIAKTVPSSYITSQLRLLCLFFFFNFFYFFYLFVCVCVCVCVCV